MLGNPERVILVDGCDETREVLARRLRAQGYLVETAADAARGAEMALFAPPSAVIADLWMPGISGVQLCRLLRAAPATMDVPLVLRGETDDPRSRFWAERAGATAYVAKGRMGDLVRALSRAIAARPADDGMFMQIDAASVDIRDRIARHLDEALFDAVIASEVRALGSCGSFERLFDLFSQFVSQVLSYRWLAIATAAPSHFALHHHPGQGDTAEREARAALGLSPDVQVIRVEDEDARGEPEGPAGLFRTVPFGKKEVGRIALGPHPGSETDASRLLTLIAGELGGPIRMTMLVEESEHLATIDPLTSLMNRRAYLAATGQQLSHAQQNGLPVSVLLLDVDHFKAINDGRGHAAGDLVLTALGTLLRKTLRDADIPARWGGEEFVATLPGSGHAVGMLVGERLRQAIETLTVCDTHGVPIPLTASVGLATLVPGEKVEALIDRADRAMYAAKVGGRNRLVAAPGDAARTAVTSGQTGNAANAA